MRTIIDDQLQDYKHCQIFKILTSYDRYMFIGGSTLYKGMGKLKEVLYKLKQESEPKQYYKVECYCLNNDCYKLVGEVNIKWE